LDASNMACFVPGRLSTRTSPTTTKETAIPEESPAKTYYFAFSDAKLAC
jgi:hypothetical protein